MMLEHTVGMHFLPWWVRFRKHREDSVFALTESHCTGTHDSCRSPERMNSRTVEYVCEFMTCSDWLSLLFKANAWWTSPPASVSLTAPSICRPDGQVVRRPALLQAGGHHLVVRHEDPIHRDQQNAPHGVKSVPRIS